MEPIFNKAKNNKEAEAWDIQQNLLMSPEERQDVAKQLRIKVFGKNPVDVRESVKKK